MKMIIKILKTIVELSVMGMFVFLFMWMIYEGFGKGL